MEHLGASWSILEHPGASWSILEHPGVSWKQDRHSWRHCSSIPWRLACLIQWNSIHSSNRNFPSIFLASAFFSLSLHLFVLFFIFPVPLLCWPKSLSEIYWKHFPQQMIWRRKKYNNNHLLFWSAFASANCLRFFNAPAIWSFDWILFGFFASFGRIDVHNSIHYWMKFRPRFFW